MAATPTENIPLGFEAPDFSLPNVVTGTQQSLTELRGEKATVLMFICNHCPFVKHVLPALVQLGEDYTAKGIKFIAISSNDVENYPEDAPDKMRELAMSMNFPFPYLYDESQAVAKAYSAACTPDFAIFDQDLRCVYRGQLDDSRPGNNIPPSGKDMRQVLDTILQGKALPPASAQKPSIGCGIKWKKGYKKE
ncbi:MAG: thioredoxin family protein [Chitinophagales bacterium]|nr:thioredoxin family protein [Bacteroidota bacterium]